MFNTRRENILEGTTEAGQRIRAWEADREPQIVSLTVKAPDRAKLTPNEAIELGRWLIATGEGIKSRATKADEERRAAHVERARRAEAGMIERLATDRRSSWTSYSGKEFS